jgi:hypothetical protein
MKKLGRIMTSVAVAAVFLSATPASADHVGAPVYLTLMFSDATKTTVVGRIVLSHCTYDSVNNTDGAEYRVLGTNTMHQESGLIGYCINEILEPIH